MTLKITTLLGAAGMMTLTACGDGFNREAGAFIDEGGFGNPTMNNMMAQMCSGRAKGHIVSDPIVVLDPSKSTTGSPVYRRGNVLCSGHLNGKYAQVIWRDYVRSGVAEVQIDGGGLEAIESAGGSN